MEDCKKVYLFMLKKSLVLFVLIALNIPQNLVAGLPSVESLLRNANNPEISKNYVETSFIVSDLAEQHKNFLVQVIFENKTGIANYWQIIYDSTKASEENIISVLEGQDYKKNLEQELFFSSLSSLLINNSSPMLSFLKKEDKNFKRNSEMINPDKLRLVRAYQYASRQDAEELRNNAVMKQPLVSNMNEVNLVQEGEEFKIEAQMKNMKMKFANENHHLLSVEYSENQRSLSLEMGEYYEFDGVYYLPKEFMIRTLTEKIYKINFVSLKQYDGTPSKLIDKVNKLKTKAIKNLQEFEDVSFLLK